MQISIAMIILYLRQVLQSRNAKLKNAKKLEHFGPLTHCLLTVVWGRMHSKWLNAKVNECQNNHIEERIFQGQSIGKKDPR